MNYIYQHDETLAKKQKATTTAKVETKIDLDLHPERKSHGEDQYYRKSDFKELRGTPPNHASKLDLPAPQSPTHGSSVSRGRLPSPLASTYSSIPLTAIERIHSIINPLADSLRQLLEYCTIDIPGLVRLAWIECVEKAEELTKVDMDLQTELSLLRSRVSAINGGSEEREALELEYAERVEQQLKKMKGDVQRVIEALERLEGVRGHVRRE
ncbi:hypothetical protein BDZ91DRAFT_784491 [Kalaharituber pfeilii]|nr:hypothetical protein BDZ91DRAFT_784491 [Kalaharituber pfeilii]